MNRVKFVNIRCTENLPYDGKGSRLWRSGLLSKYIDENTDYDLTWVISSFDHYHKQNRTTEELSLYDRKLFKNIVMLRSPGYSSNISLKRFYDHGIFGAKLFIFLLKRRSYPEILYCSYPTIESSFITVLISKMFNKVSIIDIRDKWPDVMAERFSGSLKEGAKIVLAPYYFGRWFVMKFADSVIAANSDYLNWAMKIGKRKGDCDKVFRIGFERPGSFLEKQEVRREDFGDKKLIVTYGGTIGKMFDFKTVLSAIDEEVRANVEFHFFGDGDHFEQIKAMFVDMDNVMFLGRVNSEELFQKLRQSDVLLAPYINSSNFTNHLPNKIAEYLAAGKPILTSLEGVAGELLEKENAGWIYRDSDELKGIIKKILMKKNLEEEEKNALELFDSHFRADTINKNIVKHCEAVFYSKIER